MVRTYTCEDVEVEVDAQFFVIGGTIEVGLRHGDEPRIVTITSVSEFGVDWQGNGAALDVEKLDEGLRAKLCEAIEDHAQAEDERWREARESL